MLSMKAFFHGPTRFTGAPRVRAGAIIEQLEARELFSVAPAGLTIPAGVISAALAHHKPLHHVTPRDVATVLPLKLSSISVQNGQLLATGTLGGATFTTPVTLTATPASTAGIKPAVATTSSTAVPILDLSLAPIHLNLLGLAVDTSPICLDIGAQPGSGNLLGNLLANVANLLNNGSPLGGILSGLSTTDLNSLLGGITGLLNGALGQLTAPTSLAGVGSSAAGAGGAAATNVLHLSLGPVDLNLLGLTVHLDNCSNGPVTVDITAQPGPGNLLGNLLGHLSGLLDSNASQQGILNNLSRITREIRTLL